MRTQHESIMKAITHCQDRKPQKVRAQPWERNLFLREASSGNTAQKEEDEEGEERRTGSQWEEWGGTGGFQTIGSSRWMWRLPVCWRHDGDWKWVRRRETPAFDFCCLHNPGATEEFLSIGNKTQNVKHTAEAPSGVAAIHPNHFSQPSFSFALLPLSPALKSMKVL